MTDADAADTDEDLKLQAPEDEADAPARTTAQEVVEIAKTVFYALLIALVLRVLLFQPFTIPSASMVPTLLTGDYIIVSKYSYGYSRFSIPFAPPVIQGRVFSRAPERGDVIVFKLPREDHIDYVKRLIGLPGDRIQIQNGQVFINDKPLERQALPAVMVDTGYGYPQRAMRYEEHMDDGKSYITYDTADSELDNTGVYVVPEGHYFFMGDNRDNSIDSRVAPMAMGVGMVPAANLVGKAQIILLSWDQKASLFKPWTWVLDARPSRFFHHIK